MSISSEKLYTEPGSKEEQLLQEEQERVRNQMNNEFYDEEIGSSEEAFKPAKKTGAKKSKGKTIAVTLLITGTLVAGIIFGTKAVNSITETRTIDNLISSYQVENYVALPNEVTVDRAYDITFANGEKLKERLEKKNVDYVRINGQFYTKEGIDIALLTYKVTYTETVNATAVRRDGQTIYMAPEGFVLEGTKATKKTTETRTVVVPAGTDYSFVNFPNATDFELVNEEILHTKSYDVINNSTLICDVADGATLNENNECVGTLDIIPKKH